MKKKDRLSFFTVEKKQKPTISERKTPMTSLSSRTMTGGKTDDETAMEAIQTMESLSRNYVPIINPANRKPMLQLKKHGECTLVDPRACFAHYECAADIACILYAHVSLAFFHCLAVNGYISNKERVVLRDVDHDTYVFVLVENIKKPGDRSNEDVDTILQQVHRPQGHCRPSVDILHGTLTGTPKPGYIFTQPVTLFRRTGTTRDKMRHSTTKVLNSKEWRNRIANEKAQHDCQRELFNNRQKQDIMTCRRESSVTNDGQYKFYVPTFVVEAKFGITKRSESQS